MWKIFDVKLQLFKIEDVVENHRFVWTVNTLRE